jgi:hypothetical protein
VLAVLAHNSEFALVRPLATLLLLALRRGIPAGYWSSSFPRRQLVDLLRSTELQATVCGRYVLVRAVTALDVTVTRPSAQSETGTSTADNDDSTSADVAAALSTLARRLLQEGEHGAAIELVTHQFKQQLLAGAASSTSSSNSSSSSAAAAISSSDATHAAAAAQTASSSMPTLEEVCESIMAEVRYLLVAQACIVKSLILVDQKNLCTPRSYSCFHSKQIKCMQVTMLGQLCDLA